MTPGKGAPVSDSLAVDRTSGRYLLAVHWLSDTPNRRVSTGDLREYLDVSAASVTEMVGKLDDSGLVDHEKYRGVVLTEEGHAVATRLAWRYCVVTNFFGMELDTDLSERDRYEIGYVLPEAGLDNLRARIDHPCIDNCPEST